MTYTQVWDATQGQVHDGMIQRDHDQVFIPFDPANLDYQTYVEWLNKGNTPNPYVPPPPTRQQEADAHQAGGLTIQFTSNTNLTARYPVIAPDNHNINAIATSLSYDGNTLPGGGNSVMLKDMDGGVHLFDKGSFKLLMRAIRDFVYGCQLYVMGATDSLPSNSVSKSLDELMGEVNPQ